VAKGVLTVITVCTDPAREEEYNRWYLHTHLPDLSKAKGFVKARRFRNLDATGPRRFLALYEFESPSIKESYKELLKLAMKAADTGRHISFMAPAANTGGGLWEEMEPQSFKPLEKHGYPTDTEYLRDLRKRVQGQIETL